MATDERYPNGRRPEPKIQRDLDPTESRDCTRDPVSPAVATWYGNRCSYA
jgi:hypothetical protein